MSNVSPLKKVAVGKEKLVDLTERVIATFAFVLVGNLAVSKAGGFTGWDHALDTAGFAALASVLTTIVLVWLFTLHFVNPWLDFLVRSVLTYVQSLAAAMAAAGALGTFSKFNWGSALSAASTATVLTALKALSGIRSGKTLGASIAVKDADAKAA